MKNPKPFLAFLLFSIVLTGCEKKFSESLALAEKSFAEKNHIDTIDTLVEALPRWEESDGNESKGRAYELLGKSYHQMRNTDKAMAAYKQAVELSEKSFDSATALGNLHLMKNQPQQARQNFQAAIKMKPSDPLAYLGLGNSYFMEKKTAEAIRAFEQVIEKSPGVREAQEQLQVLKSRPKLKPRKIDATSAKKGAKKNQGSRKKR